MKFEGIKSNPGKYLKLIKFQSFKQPYILMLI